MTHLLALALIVAAVSGFVAAFSPYRGGRGLLKNWVVFLLEMFGVAGLLACARQSAP